MLVTGAGEGHSAQGPQPFPAMAGSLGLMVWSLGAIDSCGGGGGGASPGGGQVGVGPWISRMDTCEVNIGSLKEPIRVRQDRVWYRF